MNEFAPTPDRLAALDKLDQVELTNYVTIMMGCSGLASYDRHNVMTETEIAETRSARLMGTQQTEILAD